MGFFDIFSHKIVMKTVCCCITEITQFMIDINLDLMVYFALIYAVELHSQVVFIQVNLLV